MKPAGPLLLLLMAGLAGTKADETKTAAPLKTSARLSQEIRSILPGFTPPVTPPAAQPETAPPSAPHDPDILELPKMVVKEKRLPRNDPDVWLTNRIVQRKAMSAYQDSMTNLEWLLNCWFVPIFSAPPSARGRQYYESLKLNDELDRLNKVIDTISLSDPKSADKMRRAMDPRKLPKDD